jgi:hypothetical protein
MTENITEHPVSFKSAENLEIENSGTQRPVADSASGISSGPDSTVQQNLRVMYAVLAARWCGYGDIILALSQTTIRRRRLATAILRGPVSLESLRLFCTES